ncbi:MAG: hypothetical protein UT63_C0029G0015, partial [Candidatus Gottesmanbacteria bacterium GW2011_GWC2_39_8]
MTTRRIFFGTIALIALIVVSGFVRALERSPSDIRMVLWGGGTLGGLFLTFLFGYWLWEPKPKRSRKKLSPKMIFIATIGGAIVVVIMSEFIRHDPSSFFYAVAISFVLFSIPMGIWF